MQNASPLKFWLPSYYFIYYAGLASLSPYLVIYYQSRGLSGSEIGFLGAISPLIGLVAAPFWSGLADATRRHKAIFLFATFSVVVTSLLIYAAGSLAWLIPAIIGFSFLGAPIMPLMDSSTMSLLEGRKDRYGRIRLWGAIGWAVAAFIMGPIVVGHGLQWAFYGYAGLVALAVLVALPIPMGNAHLTAPAPFWGGMRTLFTNPRWMFFLAIVFLIGTASPSISSYLYLYMKQIGAEALIGPAVSISTLTEIVMYFFAERILRRVKGRGLILIALSVYIVRLLLYSFIPSPTLILVIQLLHGFTGPAIWAAGVSYVAEVAPPGLGTTAQGLFQGILNGLGSATGAYLGGALLQAYSPAVMFQVFALILFVALLLFGLLGNRIPAGIEKPLDTSS
jgi:PPP family 3-phenylpropionic acid transporter